MRLVVVVQARMGSSRLPGKVMLPVAGEPLLAAMLKRLRAATTPFELVVATTSLEEDTPIVELCKASNVECYRGHPTDLLHRHYSVSLETRADAIVKIPSDCPLIDPCVIDRVLAQYRAHPNAVDFVSNLHPATFPDGNDVEVVRHGTLEVAFIEAQKDFEREHTTPYIWERPSRFRLENVQTEDGEDYSMSHRFTIDYPDDYQFVRRVFDEFGGANSPFGWRDIVALLERKPEIMSLNSRYSGVNWYRNHLGELTQITAAQTRRLEGCG